MAKEKLLSLIENLGKNPSPINLSALTFLREISDHAREQHKETTMSNYVAQRIYLTFARGIPQGAYALSEQSRQDFVRTAYQQTEEALFA